MGGVSEGELGVSDLEMGGGVKLDWMVDGVEEGVKGGGI